MDGEELGRVLRGVTEEILGRMRRSGFRVDPDDEDSPVRYDPIVWDINNGHCEPWAQLAAERIPGAFPAWIDPFHCVLVYDGKFYDADCPDGKRHWDQLPMFVNWAHPRPEP